MMNHPRGWRLDVSGLDLQGREQSLEWGRVFAAMEALESGEIANPDEHRQVGHYWLRAPDLAPTLGHARAISEAIEAIEEFGDGIRSGSVAATGGLPYTDVLHIGIGGSALGPQLVIDALGDAHLGFHFADNTDPEGIERLLAALGTRMRQTLVIIASKSGGTAEPMACLETVRASFEREGLDLPSRLVALTSPGSKLDLRAREQGWLRSFPVWEWVGGRFSVTSAVGLLPLALAGVAIREFLQGAREMDAWTRHPTVEENPAAQLAAAWWVLGKGAGERDLVVLPYRDRLGLLGRYLQQLIMESVGKAEDRDGNPVHHGLVVYGNKGTTDQHAFVQQLRDGRNDAITHFVQVLSERRGPESMGDLLQDFLLGTRRALREAGRPSLTITLDRIDAPSVAGVLALFERAVGLYAVLANLNAYHQPGVEAGKRAARGAAALRERLLVALTKHPRTAEHLAVHCEADLSDTVDLLERLVITGRAAREDHGYRLRRPLDG